MSKANVVMAAVASYGFYTLGQAFAADDIDLAGFTLTWQDEFRQRLNLTRGLYPIPAASPGWIAHTPWNGDFGFSKFDPQAFSIAPEGGLRIKAWRDAAGKWHSGMLSSCDSKGNGFSQRYGYFEAKMQMPDGKGGWPGFWVSIYPGNPGVEIDAVEFYGDDHDRYHTTWHLWEHGAHKGGKGKIVDTGVDLTAGYHTYGILIEPGVFKWYFDRREVFQQPAPAEADRPFCVYLDYALSVPPEKVAIEDPSYLSVDWVRVYERSPK